MTSAKRRRSISIDTGYINELKWLAYKNGGKTATNILTRIVEGTSPAISPMTPLTQESGQISMQEWMWLAIRNRADSRGMTSRHVLECIIPGVQPPLSHAERDLGRADARAREARRVAGEPEPKRKPRYTPRPKAKPTPKKKRARKKVPMKSEEEIVKQMRAEDEAAKKKARAKLSNGDPSTLGKDPNKIDTTAKPGEEYYSGVFSL